MQDTNGNVPPITITGVSLSLLVVLGTLAGYFGGNAKGRNVGDRQTRQMSAFNTKKAPAPVLLTALLLSSKPFSPLVSLDF